MHVIKFSHTYRKLLIGGELITRAKLLDVHAVKLENLTAELLEYDTDGKYPLPKKGNYLMLVFLKPGKDFHLFTTLRSDRPGKFDYYHSRVGELFQVAIVESESA